MIDAEAQGTRICSGMKTRTVWVAVSKTHHLGFLLYTHATFPTSFPGLQAQHIGTEALCLSELETNFSVGVQAKGQGGLRRHGLINVLQHLQSRHQSLFRQQLPG